jgi:D-arabinose 1-dehydrogenase-like Zn-dependent alcohol dehydrogenase
VAPAARPDGISISSDEGGGWWEARSGKREAASAGRADDGRTTALAQPGAAIGWAVIDFVGNAQTAQLGIDSLVKGGKYIIVGLFGGEIALSLPFLPIRAMTVQGSYTGSLQELNELIALVRKAPLPLVPTKTTALDGAQQVIADIKAGKVVGRTVLTPAG